MKKLNKIIIVFCIGFFLVGSSCRDSFLDSYPKNSLSSGTFYKNEADFTAAMNGVYDALQTNSNGFIPMMDIATPFALGGSSRFGAFNKGQFSVTPSWGWGKTMWKGFYLIAFRANSVLYRIDNEDVEMTVKAHDRIKGEALFLRSLAFFYLSNLWGDVPLILKEQSYDEVLAARTPKQEIVTQLITDLKLAESLLPSVTEYRSNKTLLGRASKGAAQMLLAKVYMYEKMYAEAETTLNEIITSGDYQLEDNFSDMYWPDNENGMESIFEIQYEDGLKESTGFVRFCSPHVTSGISYRGYQYIQPNEYYCDLFETVNGNKVVSAYESTVTDAPSNYFTFNRTSDDPAFDSANPYSNRDPRLKWTVWYEDTPYAEEFMERTGQSGVRYLSKHSSEHNHSSVKYIVGKLQPTSGDTPGNQIIMRYADVLLLYAEALIEQNKTSQGATYVNMVRQRPSVNMPVIDVNLSQSDMRKALREERYRELAFEWGHMYMDQVRWDVYTSEMEKYWTAGKLGSTWPALGSLSPDYNLWPIPAAEMSTNPNLIQNKGY